MILILPYPDQIYIALSSFPKSSLLYSHGLYLMSIIYIRVLNTMSNSNPLCMLVAPGCWKDCLFAISDSFVEVYVLDWESDYHRHMTLLIQNQLNNQFPKFLRLEMGMLKICKFPGFPIPGIPRNKLWIRPSTSSQPLGHLVFQFAH